MARPLREQYRGAVYDAMARGNHGQPMFKDDTGGLKEADLKDLPLGWPKKAALGW